METRQTHTYVKLKISQQAFVEIETLLREAGYDHAFIKQDEGYPLIDMNGIALERGPFNQGYDPKKSWPPPKEEKCAPHGVVRCRVCTHPRGD